jgi:3-oxoacyl-[acyl-carrier-protein] synthase III
MGTQLDPPAVANASGWHVHPSARKLADRAVRDAVARAGHGMEEVDLLINAGLYHDRAVGEPALAALIQEDVGMNPEDPHDGEGHGSFSFDVANGGCGVLTALQIADGFLQSGAIEHAVVVASDSHPGHGLIHAFPFAATGAAIACHWGDGPGGLLGFRWESAPGESDLFRSRISFERGRNQLRIEQHPDFGPRAAAWAGKNATALLADLGIVPTDVDLVVANPMTPGFLEALSPHLGIAPERIVAVEGAENVHTAALIVGLDAAIASGRLGDAHRVLLVSAGAGIMVGAAVLLT